jgi:hypothetical protein
MPDRCWNVSVHEKVIAKNKTYIRCLNDNVKKKLIEAIDRCVCA